MTSQGVDDIERVPNLNCSAVEASLPVDDTVDDRRKGHEYS